MAGQIYKGMLRFLDGRNEMISIPGALDKDGQAYVPGHIEIGAKYFKLNKDVKIDEWFEYQEIKNVIPFRSDLH